MFFECRELLRAGVLVVDFRLYLGRLLRPTGLPQRFYFSINEGKSLGGFNYQFFENQGFT
jgi:hypothetical protein